MPDSRFPPVEAFSPLGREGRIGFPSPTTYSRLPPHDGDNIGRDPSPGIEMREGLRPQGPTHQTSTATLGQQSSAEEHSFLHDPLNKIDTFYTANTFVPYKDHTGRQLRHLLIGSSARWLITFALCGGYVLAMRIWQNKVAQSEGQKKTFNTITTAISIALGLNIASAFKDMALNMRWPILHARTRNLVEADLILHADSLTKLAQLAFITRRPMVVFGCLFWLVANLLAQSGIAMISLTYGFNTDLSHVQYQTGAVMIPDMAHFTPQGSVKTNPSIQDEEYTAHMYGEFAYSWGTNLTQYKPKPGDLYSNSQDMLFYDPSSNRMDFIFSDTPAGSDFLLAVPAIYTNRTVNITYECESHRVTAGGDGSSLDIEVDGIGKITLSQTVPNSTTFFTNSNHTCASGPRCSTVEAFESSSTEPWYYKCNITLGSTFNDPRNVSFISDRMANIATAAIAQVGYTDFSGQEAQIYPQDSPWGLPINGSVTDMGLTMAMFGLGSIAGASIYNPTTTYIGSGPVSGVYLAVNHPYFFYLILGLICGCHLAFCIVVSILANRVMVGPDEPLSMSLLLRPVADALEGVSGGKENKAFRDAKRNTMVRYQKARNGRWRLDMIP